MADGWNVVARARGDFADMLEGLTEEQLAQPTLCEGWTSREVAGHVVSFIHLSLPKLMGSMAKKLFDVDKAWDANARSFGQQPVADIVQALRSQGAKPSAIKSFPPDLTVADVTVHTQDIRRPLGLTGAPSPDVLRMALDFCTAHKKGKMLTDPKRIAGLRLEATDMDWSWGSGDVVSGPAEAILLALNNRPVLDDLNGAGIAQLRPR